MNVPASQLDEAERPRAGGMKFTYPSGARPLDGYTIKRGVGRGGFGEVYFATSDAGKEVALKLIRRNLEVELRGVTQCLNLKHPNLVGVYDIRRDSLDDQWVIMEYVSGESLEDAIERYPNGMPVEQALGWMRGICAGVSYLHDHGIVHRDLKPGNIFLDEGTVKIGDYGLAKFISCSRRSGQTESVGTVHYMAPEISNGRYGREIDTYALGIILFEMLIGTVPFEGESVGEVLMKHLTAEPDLQRLNEPYRAIVQRALAKDPEARLKSVGELVAMLPSDVTSPAGFTPASVSDVVLASVPRVEAAANGDGDFNGHGQAAASVMPASLTSAAAGSASAQVTEIEEPIWKAVRENWAHFARNWNSDGPSGFKPLTKGLIIFAGVMGVLYLGGQIAAMAVPAAVCYGVYYVIWLTLIKPSGVQQAVGRIDDQVATALRGDANSSPTAVTAAWNPASDAPQSPASKYAKKIRDRRLRPSWRDRAQQELAAKPLREKSSELLGSMLLSAIFAGLAALMAPVLLGLATHSASMAMYLWLAIVGTLGSWAILIPAKFTEGKLEDQGPIRILMLALGGLVGAAAWLLAGTLLVSVPGSSEPLDANWGLVSHEWLSWTMRDGNPTLPMFVTYFAFLFMVVRWWRQAEYTRSKRISFWAVAGCVFAAWLMQFIWQFPQPAGMLVAGVTAFATQLASPWLPPSQRRAISGEVEPTV